MQTSKSVRSKQASYSCFTQRNTSVIKYNQLEMRRGSGGNAFTSAGASKTALQCRVKLLDGNDLLLDVNVSGELKEGSSLSLNTHKYSCVA